MTERVCCCLKPRTASLAAAFTTLVMSVVGLSYATWLLVRGGSVLRWSGLAVEGANLTLALVLIYAVRAERQWLLWWCVGVMAGLAGVGVGLAVAVGLLASLHLAILTFCSSCLQFYFALVIRSFALSVCEPVLQE